MMVRWLAAPAYLSARAPARKLLMRKPPINAVDANCMRKLQPHTKLNCTHEIHAGCMVVNYRNEQAN